MKQHDELSFGDVMWQYYYINLLLCFSSLSLSPLPPFRSGCVAVLCWLSPAHMSATCLERQRRTHFPVALAKLLTITMHAWLKCGWMIGAIFIIRSIQVESGMSQSWACACLVFEYSCLDVVPWTLLCNILKISHSRKCHGRITDGLDS